MDISRAIQASGKLTTQANVEFSAFTLFRDEDYQGKRNYIRRATRERSNLGGKASAALAAAIEATSAQNSSSIA